jgi:hypothetical protein
MVDRPLIPLKQFRIGLVLAADGLVDQAEVFDCLIRKIAFQFLL